jgi:hypothetical protein
MLTLWYPERRGGEGEAEGEVKRKEGRKSERETERGKRTYSL